MLSLRYLVLALAAVAEAGKLYGCAGSCIGKAITATGCSSSNSQCICSSVKFMETIKDCAASDCTEAQTESAVTVAEEFCNLIGDDLPQLTHEKRGGRGHGAGRGGLGHGRPVWQGNGAPWGEPSGAPAVPATPDTTTKNTELPNWSPEGERIGQGGQQGGGRPGFRGGRPGHGAPPPQHTQTASVSTPVQPAHTQTPPPKHAQPPAPAHTHSGQPTTTAAPTWTKGPSAPEHTVW